MSLQLAIVLMLVAVTIVMFAINKPRMDAVALMMMVALPFTGALTMDEALAGFSDPNIVLIAALFVIGDGLVRTGVAQRLGDWLTDTAGEDEARLIMLLMLVVCGLGATMSSTAVTAIFIPVAIRISQRTGTPAGKLMMPLSTAALISGMMTLVATAPNLVVNAELVHYLERQGEVDPRGFHFFSFTPFGLPVLALGIGYMLVARRWLPADEPSSTAFAEPKLADWIEQYKLAGREHRVRITAGSSWIGKSLADLSLPELTGARIVAIERQRTLVQPTATTELQGGDLLLVDLPASETDLAALRREHGLEALPLSGPYFTDLSQEIGMAELIVPADSNLIGQTVAEAAFRGRTGLTVIGLRRGSQALDGPLSHEPLRLGDTLLVIGPWKAIQDVRSTAWRLVVLNLPAEMRNVLPAPGKAIQAVCCMALVVGLMVSGIIPNVQAALIGCLLMGGLGCINLRSAYQSIDWKTIVLIVGMLPFSLALQRTGGVDLASDALMSVTSGAGTHGMLAALFFITAVLGLFISNTATAVLMAPVALAVAHEIDASPYPFAMIVALGASTAFMTPVSSPVNTLVVTPGNYTFGDFVRIGVPFSIVVMIVCVIMVPWLLPLY